MNRPEQEADKGTRAGSAGPSIGSPAGRNDPFGMTEWLKDMPKVPLHPLMQHPAVAMAAATAIGLGVTSHIAGFMFGAMQGMAGTAQKTGAAAEEKPAAEPAELVASTAKAADTAPVAETAKPVEAEPIKPAPVKSTPAKSAPVKTAPVKAQPVETAPATAEKPKRQKATARVVETQADDLKRISGIGPKLEQVLNGMGVRRYADVASWSDKDVKRFDEQLGFGGRIARDGWVEQAKTLVKG
ncbi:NADH:ubiquinone oxidoreductase [Pararhizobium sp. A13]|uniref:NADH:ubiquinone oxidoreductase n=1 Tax=Pararhizobium sp. A13 TaxID=3133975 RepID=UPI0032436BC3